MRETKRGKSSRYLGVIWLKDEARWRASITHAGQRSTLGQFADEQAAAEAYDQESIRPRGTRARVNFHPTTGAQVWGERLEDLAQPAPRRGSDRR